MSPVENNVNVQSQNISNEWPTDHIQVETRHRHSGQNTLVIVQVRKKVTKILKIKRNSDIYALRLGVCQ